MFRRAASRACRGGPPGESLWRWSRPDIPPTPTHKTIIAHAVSPSCLRPNPQGTDGTPRLPREHRSQASRGTLRVRGSLRRRRPSDATERRDRATRGGSCGRRVRLRPRPFAPPPPRADASPLPKREPGRPGEPNPMRAAAPPLSSTTTVRLHRGPCTGRTVGVTPPNPNLSYHLWPPLASR